jgi:hypothetical protein
VLVRVLGVEPLGFLVGLSALVVGVVFGSLVASPTRDAEGEA